MKKKIPISDVIESSVVVQAQSVPSPDVDTVGLLTKSTVIRNVEYIDSGSYFSAVQKYPEGSDVRKAIDSFFLNRGKKMYVIRQLLSDVGASITGGQVGAIADIQGISETATENIDGVKTDLTLDFTKGIEATKGYATLDITTAQATAIKLVSDGDLGFTVDGVDKGVSGVDFTSMTNTSASLKAFVTELGTLLTSSSSNAFATEVETVTTGVERLKFVSLTSGAGSSVKIKADSTSGGTDIFNTIGGGTLIEVQGKIAGPVQNFNDVISVMQKAYGNKVNISFDQDENKITRITVSTGENSELGDFKGSENLMNALGFTSEISKGGKASTVTETHNNFVNNYGNQATFVTLMTGEFNAQEKKELVEVCQAPSGTRGMVGHYPILDEEDAGHELIKFANTKNYTGMFNFTKVNSGLISSGIAGILTSVNYKTGRAITAHGKSLVGVTPEYFNATDRKEMAGLGLNFYGDVTGGGFYFNGYTSGNFDFGYEVINDTKLMREIVYKMFNIIKNGLDYNTEGRNALRDGIVGVIDKFVNNGVIRTVGAVSDVTKIKVGGMYPDLKEKKVLELIDKGYLLKEPDLATVETTDVQKGIMPNFVFMFVNGKFVHYNGIDAYVGR